MLSLQKTQFGNSPIRNLKCHYLSVRFQVIFQKSPIKQVYLCFLSGEFGHFINYYKRNQEKIQLQRYILENNSDKNCLLHFFIGTFIFLRLFASDKLYVYTRFIGENSFERQNHSSCSQRFRATIAHFKRIEVILPEELSKYQIL